MGCSLSVSAWAGSSSHVTGLHVGEDLGETLTVSCDSLIWVSEWETFPDVVISGVSADIDKSLLARGASHRSEVLLGEHSIFVMMIVTLFSEELHDLSNLLAKLGEPLHHIVSVGKLAEDLLDSVSQLVHHSSLKVEQVSLISFVWHFIVELLEITVSLGGVFLEVRP